MIRTAAGGLLVLGLVAGCGGGSPTASAPAPPPAAPTGPPAGPGAKGKKPLTEEQKAWKNLTRPDPDAP